jgi:hypothetical protein
MEPTSGLALTWEFEGVAGQSEEPENSPISAFSVGRGALKGIGEVEWKLIRSKGVKEKIFLQLSYVWLLDLDVSALYHCPRRPL